VEEAWRILKKCLRYANDIVEYVDMGKEMARVREYLMKEKGWVSRSVLMRMTNVTSKKLDEVISTLSEREEIAVDTRNVERKNNTLTKAQFYKWRETWCLNVAVMQ